MKSTSVLFFLSILIFSSFGQQMPGLDRSQLDIAYFPDNFAHDRKPGQEVIMRIIYSRPHMNGRKIFGDLVPFGKVWRTGANESTEIKIYKDIAIDGKKLESGTYSLFTIPDKESWQIIINKDLDYWGSFSYNASHDVMRIQASSKTMDQKIETFTIHCEPTGSDSGNLQMAWDDTLIEIPFTYAP